MDIQTTGRLMHKMIAHALVLLTLWLGGVAHAGTVTYVYTDPQGTPLAEADASGNVTATFDYAPYGSQALGTAPNGPGYTGHVNDPDTGLVYMQARYYDPQVGRFISTDPIGPAAGNPFNFNRFAYANNSPAVNIDPDGKCTGSLFCDGSGAGVPGVVGAGYTTFVNPGPSEGGSQAGKPGPTGGSTQNTAGAQHGTEAASGNHSMLPVSRVDTTKWRNVGEIKEGESQTVRSTGGIIVQPHTISGPISTNQFWFSINQNPLDASGKALPTASSPEWAMPTNYPTGLNGVNSGFQFFAQPGPGGNNWTVTYPGQEDWHQNAGESTLTIYAPRP